MAVYKVAQDVEADDKLIGPFSARQFIYLAIVAMAIAMAWGLSRLFIPLFIIPLPIIIFFGALALPLRKDQPMEVYMAALVSFYLKPRKRTWEPDGIESLVEITAPHVEEVQRAKDLSQYEAERRLSYLADIADTGGWAIRHTTAPAAASSMTADVYNEAQQTEDMMDDSTGVARTFDTMIDRADTRRREEIVERMRNPSSYPTAAPSQPAMQAPGPPPIADPYAALSTPTAPVTYNPYPTEIHQRMILPMDDPRRQSILQPPVARPPASPAQPNIPASQPNPVLDPSQNHLTSTSDEEVSPDIIKLANNSDLSIETIQREAGRIHKKQLEDEGEVVISLR